MSAESNSYSTLFQLRYFPDFRRGFFRAAGEDLSRERRHPRRAVHLVHALEAASADGGRRRRPRGARAVLRKLPCKKLVLRFNFFAEI